MNPSPRLLIAEDEPLLAGELAGLLRQIWPQARLVATARDGLDAVRQALEKRPDVCFLDIRMPGQSGLDAASALIEDWPETAGALPLLVFVTAFDQHALAAFEACAVDYLLKPVQRPRLERTVRHLQERLAGRASRASDASTPPAGGADPGQTEDLTRLARLLQALDGATGRSPSTREQPAGPSAARLRVIPVASGESVRLLSLDEVLLFEAADKVLRVLTASGEHLIRTSLRELLPQLGPTVFWQIHRGSIVRIDAVRRAVRDRSGRCVLEVDGLKERPVVSRLHAGRFRPM